MSDAQLKKRYEIGMVGLGVMGRNLVLNMADHEFSVAGYDKDLTKVEALRKESAQRNIRGAAGIPEFIALLRQPRAVMMLVPAGAPVDSVIKDLLPHLDKGDLIIDAGNSYFKDTDVRGRNLAAKGIQFLGVGVSGGEEGARHGLSMMPGGPKEVYERVRLMFEAIAAKVNGDSCVAWLGPGSTGHFVKMVHNGVEYGVMQLIAETYDLMKCALGLNDDELHGVFSDWNKASSTAILWRSPARFSPAGREDRQADDRRNPQRRQAERHRHSNFGSQFEPRVSRGSALKKSTATSPDWFRRVESGSARDNTSPVPLFCQFSRPVCQRATSPKTPTPKCVYPLWNHWSQGRSSSSAKSSWWARALRVSSPTRTNWLCSAKAVKSVKAKIKMSICTSIEVGS